MTLYVEEITDSNEGLIRLLLEYVTNSDAQVSESAIYGLKRVLCSNIDKKNIPKTLKSYLSPFEKSIGQSEGKSSFSVVLSVEDVSEAVRKVDWSIFSDHDTWIKNMVATLLEAYPQVKDGYISKVCFVYHLLCRLCMYLEVHNEDVLYLNCK
jgi:hypothetical protein